MRRPVAWALGGFAIFGFLRRRRPQADQAPEADPRAEALREKLVESRALVEGHAVVEAAEAPVVRVELPDEDPELRRRAVHEAGRAAAEQMRTER